MSSGTASRRAARAQEVVGDALGRRAVVGERAAARGVGAAERLLGQPGGQLLAHEGVAEAIAAARALEHARRLGLAERVVGAVGARERGELRRA